MSSPALFSKSCVRFPPPLSESALDVIELFQVVMAEHTPSAQSAVDCRLGDSSDRRAEPAGTACAEGRGLGERPICSRGDLLRRRTAPRPRRSSSSYSSGRRPRR
jgi:hypothetical protein